MGPDQLNAIYVVAAIVLTITALCYLYRIAYGPTVFDRLLGLSGVGTKAVVLVVLVGSIYGQLDMFIDIAVGYALLNYLGALAAARYFAEPESQEDAP